MRTIVYFLLLTFSVACSTTRPFTTSNGARVPTSVAEIRRLKINSSKQFLTIRGVNRANPVLLWLHGGPGNVAMPLYLHYNAPLEEQFTVVYWDQRGSGKSYSSRIPAATMTLEQFVEDTHALTSWLKNQFNQEKIVLVGHSWGGLLGLHVINKYPNDYYALAALSPPTDGPRSEQLSYEFTLNTARQRQDTVGLATLNRIGSPVNGLYRGGISDQLQQRGLVHKYGGAYHRNIGGSIYKILRRSTEYHLLDYLKVKKIERLSLPMLQAVLPSLDLKHQIPAVNVPDYFFLGRYDQVCPATVAADYCQSLKAPYKEVVWFDESAHHTCYEEPQKFNVIVKEKLLPLMTGKSLLKSE